MTHSAIILSQEGRLMVSGDLNFLTVPMLWKQSLPLLSASQELQFDLEKITSSNSAGLALLVEWMKYAEQSHKKIHFHHVPPQIDSLMKAMGLKCRVD